MFSSVVYVVVGSILFVLFVHRTLGLAADNVAVVVAAMHTSVSVGVSKPIRALSRVFGWQWFVGVVCRWGSSVCSYVATLVSVQSRKNCRR